MNKSKLNFIIDIFMFICMTLIASIGFLIKFTLITGMESREIYGKNVDLLLFGMDRHQWGTIHLYIGFILLALLALHIFLHWKMIVGLYHKLIITPKTRKVSFWTFIAVSFFLIASPFIVSPKVVEREHGKGYHSIRRGYENETEATMNQPEDKLQSNSHGKRTISGIAIEVRGYMTVAEVSQKYNVPVNIIMDQLGIPGSALSLQKIGKLRKMYGFEMTDIEKIIYEYRKSH